MPTASRQIEILAAVLNAFANNRVDGAGLTADEWTWAESEIEGRFKGDFEAVAAHLRAEMTACALVCGVVNNRVAARRDSKFNAYARATLRARRMRKAA
jgi:hypothetical protein